MSEEIDNMNIMCPTSILELDTRSAITLLYLCRCSVSILFNTIKVNI